jgi:adenylate kinase
MDRSEKLQFQKSIEEYFDENRVYDLFEKLFKELIVNKPENPIDYLINRIGKQDTKRIFITGYQGTHKKFSALAAAGELGYSCASMGDLLEKEILKKGESARVVEKSFYNSTLVDDEIVLDVVRKQLIEYEEKNSSYIIVGFPRNRVN